MNANDPIQGFLDEATNLAITVGVYLADLDHGAPADRTADSLTHLRIAYQRLQEGVARRMAARKQEAARA